MTMKITKISTGRERVRVVNGDVIDVDGIVFKSGNHPIPHNIIYHADYPDI